MGGKRMDQEFKIRLSTMRRRLLESAPVENAPSFQVHPSMLKYAAAVGRQLADNDFKEVEAKRQKDYTD